MKLTSLRYSGGIGTKCRKIARPVLVTGLLVAALGCGSLNPAFVDVLDPNNAGGLTTIDNATGHLVLSFVNNAGIDERIISYLESAEGGSLELTPAEKRSMRALMRFRLLVTFTDGTQNAIEFISGSRVVAPDFQAQSEQDLAQNDLTNTVVLCDVERIDLLPGSNIEVFIPVAVNYYVFQEPTDATEGFYRLNNIRPPGYYALQTDVTNTAGNVFQANIGLRDVIAPVVDPGCGTSVSIVVNGTLSVPFELGTGIDESSPGVDSGDQLSVLTIGGRYSFEVSVR